MKIIDGKQLSESIYIWIKQQLQHIEKKPKLAIIQATKDESSLMYIKMKMKKAEELGIEVEVIEIPELSSADDVIYKIHDLNTEMDVTGVMVQLPLYEHLEKDRDLILNTIASNKDVDGLTYPSLGKTFFYQNDSILPATVDSIIECLRFSTNNNLFELRGKNVVILNNTNLIGKPLSVLLQKFNATVISANEYTENLNNLTQNADVIVSATGKTNLIDHTMIKEGAILIDVTSKKVADESNPEGKIIGDIVRSEELDAKAGYITPVPGGVGPLTIACLLKNLVNLK